MTEQNIHKFYKILDVTPDTPWEDIKRTYHDMMRVWHPDRFAGDPRLQKIVEEKTKELTHAFKKIEEDYHSIKFYRDPLDEAEEAPIETKAQQRTESPVKEEKPRHPRYASKQEAEEWLKKAKALDTGNYNVVVDFLNKAIDLDPFLEEAYIERGEAFAMLGYHGQAVKDFNEVIELNSKSFRGFRGRANAYSELGNHSQAIIDFTSALELEPANYPELYYLRGKSHEKLGNRDEAKEDFRNAKVLKILSSQSHESQSPSELDNDWIYENKSRFSYKQAGLHIIAIICVLFGILVLALPFFLSKDNEKAEPKKELIKGIIVPASLSRLLEKAIPVPGPVPISDYDKALESGKHKPTDDTLSSRQAKETRLITAPLEREKLIQERTSEVTPAEKEGPSVQKKQGRIQRENNDRIFREKTDQVKEVQTQVSRGKTITDTEKEQEPEKKKFQQFEKLRKLEKEFPFEILKPIRD